MFPLKGKTVKMIKTWIQRYQLWGLQRRLDYVEELIEHHNSLSAAYQARRQALYYRWCLLEIEGAIQQYGHEEPSVNWQQPS